MYNRLAGAVVGEKVKPVTALKSAQKHLLQQLARGWTLSRIEDRYYIYPPWERYQVDGRLAHKRTVDALISKGFIDQDLNYIKEDSQ